MEESYFKRLQVCSFIRKDFFAVQQLYQKLASLQVRSCQLCGMFQNNFFSPLRDCFCFCISLRNEEKLHWYIPQVNCNRILCLEGDCNLCFCNARRIQDIMVLFLVHYTLYIFYTCIFHFFILVFSFQILSHFSKAFLITISVEFYKKIRLYENV